MNKFYKESRYIHIFFFNNFHFKPDNKAIQIKPRTVCLFIQDFKEQLITIYILIIYELNNLDHVLGIVPQTRVAGGNRTQDP